MKYFFRKIAFGTPDYDQSINLRDLVLRKPLGLYFTEEQLSEEWNQIHLGCFSSEQELIGILVLKLSDNHEVKMRQVAVHPNTQGKNIGTQLVKFSEMYTRKLGKKQISLHARKAAVPFYEKLNYKIKGDLFEEVGIPHYFMSKSLY